jgi:hypothetical protein
MQVTLFEFLFCDRCYVRDFDNEISKERTKVIDGISFVRIEEKMGSLVLKPDTMVEFVGEPHIKIA